MDSIPHFLTLACLDRFKRQSYLDYLGTVHLQYNLNYLVFLVL